MTITKDTLLDTFQTALDEGTAAFFIGAGMSRGAGFVDWRDLVRDIAKDLELDVDKETDLIALAQYHVNQRKGRAHINQKLINEFTKQAIPTENHRLIASLPVHSVWTTNYDNVLEDAFAAALKRVDVKKTPKNLTYTKPKRDVTIYKMHGDVDLPDEAVLTKADFETYSLKRELFSVQLRGDLVSKTFLFLGYSFSDPNIDYILARIRVLLGEDKRDHFCIMRAVPKPKTKSAKKIAEYEYELRKQELRIEDLQNYGIQTLLIEEYTEITSILQELNRRVDRKNVFVSGSAHDFSPLGPERILNLARSIGMQIIEHGYNLVSGMGLGIGGAITIGAMEALYRSPASDLDERTTLRPFPQVEPTSGNKKEMWTRYRDEMISKAGFAIFICGNKLKEGKVVEANGVIEEFDLAIKHGVYPIPIGATGHVAAKLWTMVASDVGRYFGAHQRVVARSLQVLNKANVKDAEIVAAIFSILKAIAPK